MAAAAEDPRGLTSSPPPPALTAATGSTPAGRPPTIASSAAAMLQAASSSDRPSFCDHCCREHRLAAPHECEVPSDDDDAAEESSTGSSGTPNPKVLRTFATDAPLQWSVFNRLRKSTGATVPTLSPQQESNVTKALTKIQPPSAKSGASPQAATGGAPPASPPVGSSISDSLPFVSVFVQQVCPELKASREGATFTILAVITGHAAILKQCLELGANPNDTRFMSATSSQPNSMRHGFSPFFLACICEQMECMELLAAKGASLHVFDRWGRTPLHAAAAMGSDQVVQWLLARGAPRTVPDRDTLRPGEIGPGRVRLCAGGPVHVPALFSRRVLEPTRQACHCGSGKNRGECLCFDDMRERWYMDRVASEWLPSEFYDVIANTQLNFEFNFPPPSPTPAQSAATGTPK